MYKSPISVLQEYAIAQGVALPNYTIYSEVGIFKCIVSIGNIVKDATAANKKTAKHAAAEKAVAVLQNEGVLHVTATESIYPVEVQEPCPVDNKVGKLNEFCLKLNIKPADYEFIMHSPTQFSSKCRLQKYETVGMGKNKKEAKQIAANHMLQIVNSEKSAIEVPVRSTFTPSSDDVDEKSPKNDQMIIELFKQLSFRNQALTNGETGMSTATTNLQMEEIYDMIEEAQDKDSLKNLLAKLGVEYQISTFQTRPFLMCIKTKMGKHPPFTFLQDGSDACDTTLKLLKAVVDAIVVHC